MATHARSIRRPAVVAALLFILTIMAAPVAGAQQSQDVEVTAVVDSYLAITLCDLSAEFGSGLTPLGAAPTGTDEVTYVTTEGTDEGEGVFYVWQPGCPGDLFLTVESNLGDDVFACATENSGDGVDVRVDQGDLRYRRNAFPLTYDQTEQFTTAFPLCADGIDPQFSRDEHDQEAIWYMLRVDNGDEPGAFLSTTTWSVVAS